MNNIFAERLKSARQLNGMSLQDLADALENVISKQALHKYEKGEVLPDSERLHSLCVALKVRPDYFSRSTNVELGAIEYRKLTNLPAKEEMKILEMVKEYLERYLELEEIIGLDPEFENPLKDIDPITSNEDVEKAASTLRKKWGLGVDPLYNVAQLLEDKFIKVVPVRASENFDGLQTWLNQKYAVVAYNETKLNRPDRIRFTLLHELAHLLLEHKFGNITERAKENYCHFFAGAMLFPKEAMTLELGTKRSKLHVQELAALKKEYGISMQAIVMRAFNSNIVNQRFKSDFFTMMNQMGWSKEEPAEYQGEEKSSRFEQLIYRALAEEQISISKAAALKNITVAEFRNQMQVLD
jgi:Zn-dependent peptidase ImmA (M78 family)/DNA-binding XRE family transcriptional regulator